MISYPNPEKSARDKSEQVPERGCDDMDSSEDIEQDGGFRGARNDEGVLMRVGSQDLTRSKQERRQQPGR